MTIDVYGLRTCDSCRKALAWLREQGIEHRFVDVRVPGIDMATVTRWSGAAGWETLLNRRGTTWRGLPDAEKDDVDEARAIALMVAHPALIKRPVFEIGGEVMVGFGEEVRARLSGG